MRIPFVATRDYLKIATIEQHKKDEAYVCLFEEARRKAVRRRRPGSGVHLSCMDASIYIYQRC